MGYQDARNLVGGLFQEARLDVVADAVIDALPHKIEPVAGPTHDEMEAYWDAALDVANLSLAETVRLGSISADRFDAWFPHYSAATEASRRTTRTTSRELGVALAKWGIDSDVGQ